MQLVPLIILSNSLHTIDSAGILIKQKYQYLVTKLKIC